MLTPHPSRVFNYTKEQEIQNFLTDWIFHSHNWLEVQPGYYECKWCGSQHTSEMPLSIMLADGGFQYIIELCPRNPVVRELVDILTLTT